MKTRNESLEIGSKPWWVLVWKRRWVTKMSKWVKWGDDEEKRLREGAETQRIYILRTLREQGWRDKPHVGATSGGPILNIHRSMRSLGSLVSSTTLQDSLEFACSVSLNIVRSLFPTAEMPNFRIHPKNRQKESRSKGLSEGYNERLSPWRADNLSIRELLSAK